MRKAKAASGPYRMIPDAVQAQSVAFGYLVETALVADMGGFGRAVHGMDLIVTGLNPSACADIPFAGHGASMTEMVAI